MSIILILNLLFIIILQTHSRFFLLSSNPQKTAFYQCLKSNGNEKVVTVLAYNQDLIDEDCLQGAYNALNAGLKVEFVFLAYRCRSPEQELQFLRSKLELGNFDKFWLAPTVEIVPECSWKNYTPEENCEYLQKYFTTMKASDLQFGIIIDKDSWTRMFGSQTACPEIGSSLLWWIPATQEEAQGVNFDTYHQIGGWKTPYAKVLAELTSCGQPVVVNYFV